jgi:hypothetical protein
MLQDQVNTGLQYPHDEELMIRTRGQNEENKDSPFYSWVNQDLIIKVSI